MSNIKDYLVTVRTTNDASPTATLVMLGNDVLFKLDNNDPIPVSGENVAQSSEVLDYTSFENDGNFVGEPPSRPPRPDSPPPPPPRSASRSVSPPPRPRTPFRTGLRNTSTGGRVNKTGKKMKRKPRTKTLKR